MKRKPAAETEDSAILCESILQVIKEGGRGMQAEIAREIGITANALGKRLRRPGSAFDGPTLRATLYIAAVVTSRSEAQPPSPTEDTPAPQE